MPSGNAQGQHDDVVSGSWVRRLAADPAEQFGQRPVTVAGEQGDELCDGDIDVVAAAFDEPVRIEQQR